MPAKTGSMLDVAAEADGLFIEIYPDHSASLCDGANSLEVDKFENLMLELKLVASAIGRNLLK